MYSVRGRGTPYRGVIKSSRYCHQSFAITSTFLTIEKDGVNSARELWAFALASLSVSCSSLLPRFVQAESAI